MHVEFVNKMLTNKTLSIEDRGEWTAYMNRLPKLMQDVYYTPDYYEIYEKNGDGKAFCFVFEDVNHLALYPFLLNRINDLGYELDKSFYDIQGAYGYNGVLSTSNDPYFIEEFYNEFNKFCEHIGIIAEFTRFQPLFGNHKFSKGFLDIIYNRKTVYVNLKQKYDEIYQNYSHSTKGNLKTALKNNVIVLAYINKFPYSKDFISMYKETMDRVNAEPYLYFNEDYFENTFYSLPVIQFVVFKNELPVASSICLTNSYNIYIHFEASKKQYLHLRPNDILIDTITKWAIGNGYKTIYLGGGTNQDEEDSLLRFKEKFSKTTRDFYIGKKIHNSEIYNRIIEQWSTKYPHLVDKYKNTLLKYRKVY